MHNSTHVCIADALPPALPLSPCCCSLAVRPPASVKTLLVSAPGRDTLLPKLLLPLLLPLPY
jgi:hypothetical protein